MDWNVNKTCRAVFAVGIAVFALAGCVIESKQALHEEAQKVPIQTIMVGQMAGFRSAQGDYVFLRREQGQMTVILTKFSGAIAADKTFQTALYQMAGLPQSVYVAVRSGEGLHEYLPFHYDRSGILILAPRQRTRVKGMAEFHATLADVKGKPLFYERLGRDEAAEAYKRYSLKQIEKRKTEKRREHEYVNPYRTFDTGIERLSVGDEVFWLRALSTDRMTVTQINISTGYIELRRETDYVIAKVHHSHIMTIRQAGENGIKHGVSTARSAFCLAHPKECQW